jgi:hypothetical protein
VIGFKSGPVLPGIGISSPIFILIARLFGYIQSSGVILTEH